MTATCLVHLYMHVRRATAGAIFGTWDQAMCDSPSLDSTQNDTASSPAQMLPTFTPLATSHTWGGQRSNDHPSWFVTLGPALPAIPVIPKSLPPLPRMPRAECHPSNTGLSVSYHLNITCIYAGQ